MIGVKEPWWIPFIGILFILAFFAFVLMDAPETTDSTLRIVVRYEDPPYPEEDTMHYLTEEGEVIIYDTAGQEPEISN